MAEDWLADVRKYAPAADEATVDGIVRYCGIALQKRDSALVAFSDPAETAHVRDTFLKKKLALTDSDDVLDQAIAAVGERMKADRTKNRVTVYYLLAEHFGKLGLFAGKATDDGTPPVTDGSDTTGAALLAGAAGLGAAGVAGAAGISETPAKAGTPVDAGTSTPTPPGALESRVAAGIAGVTGAAAGIGAAGSAHGGAAGHHADTHEGEKPVGFARWWPWLLLALIVIALFLLLRSCNTQPAAVTTTNTTVTETSVETDNMADIDGNLVAPAPTATPAATEAPVPTGDGVVAGMRDGLPLLTVYFATGKTAVTPDFGKVAATIKDYAAAHPGAKLAVSGYNDPTGNAAANARLSKNRAQAVAAALGTLGVPADAVVLEKPADTTLATGDNAAARKVEVTVKQ